MTFLEFNFLIVLKLLISFLTYEFLSSIEKQLLKNHQVIVYFYDSLSIDKSFRTVISHLISYLLIDQCLIVSFMIRDSRGISTSELENTFRIPGGSSSINHNLIDC